MSTSDLLAEGLRLHQAGQFPEAENIYRQILEQEPSNVAAWHLLGRLAMQFEQHETAIQCIGKALNLRPDYAGGHLDIGSAYEALGRLDEAIVSYEQALALQPTLVGALNNLGTALKAAGRLDEAVVCLNQGLRLNAQQPELHNNLGLAYREQGKLAEAIQCFERAIKLKPRYAEAFNHLALVYRDLGQHEQAATHFRRAAALNPRYADGRFNKAMHWLLLGDFARGWPEYEWRWQRKDFRPRGAPELVWDGRELAGQRLLLHAEQGLGDTIQFARYAALCKQRGATVIFAAQKALVPLISGCAGIDELIDLDSSPPPFDFHAPLLSLPRILGTTLETIPAAVPYLSADPELQRDWSGRLAQHGGLKVGIAWQGRPDFRDDRDRSFRVSEFAPLAAIAGFTLISLQKGAGAEQLRDPDLPFSVVNFGDDLDASGGAFMDTAAIMKNLDLVITSDTAVAHLGGRSVSPLGSRFRFAPTGAGCLIAATPPGIPRCVCFASRRVATGPACFKRCELHLKC